MKFSKAVGTVLLLMVPFMTITGCVTGPQPVLEYALARVALESARTVEGPRHSPGYFHQAEESFRRGVELFEDRDYERAKAEFRRCRVAAERAENSARLIRAKSGEVF